MKSFLLSIGGVILAAALVLGAFGADAENILARGRAMVSTLPAMLNGK